MPGFLKAIMPMKLSVIIRFIVIGLLWLFFCGWFVGRLNASGEPLTLLSLMPIPISGVIVFVPLYKKYVKNNGKQGQSK